MNYAQSNYLIDTVMPKVKPTTFKVIVLIARQTWGWKGRESVELSYTDLKTLTGIKSHNTLKEAMDEAGPYINQTPGETQGFIYSMKPIMTMSNFDTPESETVSKNDMSKIDTVSENDIEAYQNLTPPLSKNDTDKGERVSKNDIDTRPPKEYKEERNKKEYGYKNGHELPADQHPYPEEQMAYEEMLSAICRVVKQTYAPGLRDANEFEKTAEAFVNAGYTPEQVIAFRTWWEKHTWYKDKSKASLKTLRDEIQNSIASNDPMQQSSVQPIVWNEEWDNDPYQRHRNNT